MIEIVNELKRVKGDLLEIVNELKLVKTEIVNNVHRGESSCSGEFEKLDTTVQ